MSTFLLRRTSSVHSAILRRIKQHLLQPLLHPYLLPLQQRRMNLHLLQSDVYPPARGLRESPLHNLRLREGSLKNQRRMKVRVNGRRRCMTIQEKYVTLSSYRGFISSLLRQDPGDISLKANQRVLVTERSSDDWYKSAVTVLCI